MSCCERKQRYLLSVGFLFDLVALLSFLSDTWFYQGDLFGSERGTKISRYARSARMTRLVENAVKQLKEKVRVLIVRNHVTLLWCIKFAGQVLSRTVKGQDGLTAFQRAYQRKSHPRPLPAAWGENVLYLEASKRKAQLSDKFEDEIFLGIRTALRS